MLNTPAVRRATPARPMASGVMAGNRPEPPAVRPARDKRFVTPLAADASVSEDMPEQDQPPGPVFVDEPDEDPVGQAAFEQRRPLEMLDPRKMNLSTRRPVKGAVPAVTPSPGGGAQPGVTVPRKQAGSGK
jgi:hypothetical protein